MEYLFQAAVAPAEVAGDCVVVGVYKDGLLSNAAYQLDTQSNGALRKYLDMGDFTGKKQELALYYHIPNVSSKRVLLVGLGDKKKMTLAALLQATRSAVRYLNDRHIQQAVSFLSDEASHEEQSLAVRRSVQAAAATLYRFDAYKSVPKKEKKTGLAQWTIAHTEEGDHRVALEQGEGIAQGMSLARDLGNQPGNVCTPTYLEEVAKGIVADSAKASLEVLEESDMEALGMGAFMSVSKGSSQPGKMLILHYNGGEESEPPVLLLGKGITFDTGGISLKPGAKMDEMKYDMMGAGSVLGSLRACVDMQLPLNVIGMVAAAENMPSGHASKPGDIVKTLSGKTVEILNTDAEGRLVLCDALTYAERFKPALVVDVATLTGACIVALGHHISALMANDDALAEELTAIGKSCDDEVWRLPLGDLYQEQLKSNFADMANIGGPSAGAITAGCFLARFAGQFKWAHLDIAGTAWEGGASKGATGRPVPLLTGLLLKKAKLI